VVEGGKGGGLASHSESPRQGLRAVRAGVRPRGRATYGHKQRVEPWRHAQAAVGALRRCGMGAARQLLAFAGSTRSPAPGVEGRACQGRSWGLGAGRGRGDITVDGGRRAKERY
jgi:hypothetical protein